MVFTENKGAGRYMRRAGSTGAARMLVGMGGNNISLIGAETPIKLSSRF